MIIYFMANNKPQDYVDPKNVDSLEGITSFNVPELLVDNILDSVNQSVNGLLSLDYEKRYNALLDQFEIKNLSKEKFLESIVYFVNHISEKRMFDSVELPQVISDLYNDLDYEVVINGMDEFYNNPGDVYENSLAELDSITEQLKSKVRLNKSLILNINAKGLSYEERLLRFSNTDLYKNISYQSFKENDIDYLDEIQRLCIFDASELLSILDCLKYRIIDKLYEFKTIDIKKELE